MNKPIDFVLTYLDGNDPEWQREKGKYTPGGNADINPNRYRDWDNLQYFFRSIEKFAPWVNKVHIVTCGHVPSWLNADHPKINIVRHEDFIPSEWLPTFSSRCIDMNLHRIADLSEQFVYFNDDMFLTAPVEPEFFFKNGLPCDAAVMSAQGFNLRDGVKMYFAPYVDTGVINKYFKKKAVLKSNRGKWFSPKYHGEILRTMTMLPYPHFICFRNFHLPYAYLKSTYEEVWQREPDFLAQTCSHRFREVADANHFLFTYWQYVTGRFTPRDVHQGKAFQLHSQKDAETAAHAITEQRYKMVCLNDAVDNAADFPEIKSIVNTALDGILKEKTDFEKF